MGFIKYLFDEYIKTIKLKKLDKKKDRLLKQLVEDNGNENLRKEWAKIINEEKMIENEEYAKMVKLAEKMNYERGV